MSSGPAISALYWRSGTDQGLPLWPEHSSGPTMVAMVNIAERVPGRSPARPAHYKGVASC